MVATASPKISSVPKNGMAKKDKASGKKGDKPEKSTKKSPADLMLDGSTELRNTVAAIE